MTLTPKQLTMRSTGIGASEIAAVCGLSPWDSAHDVWARKVGLAAEKTETAAMRAGNMLEAAICDWYAVEMGGVKLLPCETMRHPVHAFALATPDRVYANDPTYLVQCKNVGLRMAEHWGEDPEKIPEDYRVQIEWEMEVAGAKRCDVVVLIGGQTLRIYPIHRNEVLAAHLLKIGEAFWTRHVLTQVPPPPDASEGAKRFLESKHPRQIAPLTDCKEADEWARRYYNAVQAEKAAEEEKKLCGNVLRGMIGSAEGVRGSWGKATWKCSGAGTPSWKKISEALGATPELIAQHTPKPPRVLRVYPKKEK